MPKPILLTVDDDPDVLRAIAFAATIAAAVLTLVSLFR